MCMAQRSIEPALGLGVISYPRNKPSHSVNCLLFNEDTNIAKPMKTSIGPERDQGNQWAIIRSMRQIVKGIS